MAITIHETALAVYWLVRRLRLTRKQQPRRLVQIVLNGHVHELREDLAALAPRVPMGAQPTNTEPPSPNECLATLHAYLAATADMPTMHLHRELQVLAALAEQ